MNQTKSDGAFLFGYLIGRKNAGSGGGGAGKRSDVNLLDYDGTVAYSYTKEEFLALTELPDNPTHDGLTAQGWNRTLADAQAYVTEYGMLDIGQMYVTDDGKTRLTIKVDQLLRADVPVYFSQTAANGVTVNWGDGSAEETFAGTGDITSAHHVYAETGTYCITLAPAEGCTLGLGIKTASYCVMGTMKYSNAIYTAYTDMLQTVEIGAHVTEIPSYAFQYCLSLSSVTIPESVTSIGSDAFSSCYNLQSVSIPSSVTTIKSNAFGNCLSLQSVSVPGSVTTMESSAFYNCSSLQRISIPSSITSIANDMFQRCFDLAHITIPSGVTSIASGAFYYCYDLAGTTIPESVTSIGSNAFNICTRLGSIRIPSGVTRIERDTFSFCYTLISVSIPSGVTSIGSNAFGSCVSLAELKFEGSTPPTVANVNAFSKLNTDCRIYVPAGSLSAYTTATNYPNPSTYTYVEYEEGGGT